MKRARSKPKTPAADATPAHPDRELIGACMDFSIALHGASGAFKVDPTGDGDFARTRDGAFLRRADAAQLLIAKQEVNTLDGLRSKAAALQCGLQFDRDAVELLATSLAADVVRIHRLLIDGKRIATDAELAL